MNPKKAIASQFIVHVSTAASSTWHPFASVFTESRMLLKKQNAHEENLSCKESRHKESAECIRQERVTKVTSTMSRGPTITMVTDANFNPTG